MPRSLRDVRAQYQPELPSVLSDLHSVAFAREDYPFVGEDKEAMSLQFPLTMGRPLLKAGRGERRTLKKLRVGVVFSGGQAAGGHNVITGLFDALKALDAGSRLFGFLDGPGGIVKGNAVELTAEALKGFRNQGGFDLIGSGRTKIETEEQLMASLAAMQKYDLDGLVIIGGDDSNTNAAILAEYFLAQGCKTAVVGVPKTIDGDLKNPYVATSFGFDSACKVYAEMIGNIARDVLSAKKYYHFVKVMGRSASHIALECALLVHPNLTLISEEGKSLAEITDEIADLICKRAELGKNYGMILIPEGLIEFIPEVGVLIAELNTLLAQGKGPSDLTQESRGCFSRLPEAIQKQLLYHRDPHGNVQVSLIETEILLIEAVEKELAKREKEGRYRGKFCPQHHFFGYEGRSGFPSNFDATYCYALGHVAALLVDEGATGCMCFVHGLDQPVATWQVGGLPMTGLMHFEMRKGKRKPVIKKALVDLQGAAFGLLKKQGATWALEDCYASPGPIQFEGDPDIVGSVPITITL